jgi:hypothetical protein
MLQPPVAGLEALIGHALRPAVVPKFDTLVRQLSSRKSSVLHTVADATATKTWGCWASAARAMTAASRGPPDLRPPSR